MWASPPTTTHNIPTYSAAAGWALGEGGESCTIQESGIQQEDLGLLCNRGNLRVGNKRRVRTRSAGSFNHAPECMVPYTHVWCEMGVRVCVACACVWVAGWGCAWDGFCFCLWGFLGVFGSRLGCLKFVVDWWNLFFFISINLIYFF